MTDETPEQLPDQHAIGDDAIAAGMDLVLGSAPANTIETEINKTRDYIAQRTKPYPLAIANGGTGANNAAAARAALSVAENRIGGLKWTSPAFGRIAWEAPGVANQTPLANLNDVRLLQDVIDALLARVEALEKRVP